jgi:hypothetical protein
MDDHWAAGWVCAVAAGVAPAAAGLRPRGSHARAIDSLVATARHHRIHLVLAAACGTSAEEGEVRQALADDVRRAVLENALREQEIRRVVEACSGAGVDVLIFKGAALAWSVYDRPWTRPFVDVDVLVQESQVPTVRRVLAALGYEQRAQVDGALITRQAAFVREGRAGVRHQVDVHWRLFNPEPVGHVFTHEELMARSQPLPALGPAARRPAHVDALVIAAVHRAAHHNDADDLIWTWDVDRLARSFSPGDWEVLSTTACERGVAALCAAGLSRAAVCFGTPVPGHVQRVLDGAGAEAAGVFLGGTLGELDIQLANLAHLRWRDRPAFVAQHLFPSPAYMRRAYGAAGAAGLAWSYAARLASGIPRWLRSRRMLGAAVGHVHGAVPPPDGGCLSCTTTAASSATSSAFAGIRSAASKTL